ncbi:alpha/beta hydrolase [uncultured Roseobacter sp.]|uniref:alpha/beta fold hydrolase n=1 Tax=uncultured Roseobacter sp. TaxID=114847 RepID=UPI00262B41F1|nr:alpha/beta hydrolase [uncultured Roseobacter sp.]
MQMIDGEPKATVTQDMHHTDAAVMALHCSGSDSTQWQHLDTYLAQETELILPTLAGAEAVTRGWSRKTYTLAEEAKPLVDALHHHAAPMHLVGHSYGGAVALHIARHHPERVVSLCLYEPTSFSLLSHVNQADRKLFDEIETLAVAIENAVAEGCPDFAAQVFTDFWGGVGTWQALRRDRRAALIDWIPKCPLDFGALLYEPPGAALPAHLPVTLMVGTQSQRQTQRIVQLLRAETSQASVVEVDGAGHLGPFTFRDRIAGLISAHFQRVGKPMIAAGTVGRGL